MLRAAIYARVSTDEQVIKGYSLVSQVEECKARAVALGATEVLEFIDEGQSGAFLDRPGMNGLRDAVQKNLVDIIICYDPDRFARNLSHQLIVTEEIEKAGVKLEFINFDWQNTPEGKLFYSIRGAVAEYEREKIKERVNRGKKRKAREGKVVFNSRPYGYRYDKDSSAYVIDEDEAQMVREIFRLYTQEKLGILKICEWLALNGYKNRKGKTDWAVSTINGILKNEAYTGTAWAFKTYKRKIGPKKYERGTRPQAEWIPIPVPAIIDHATFEAAQRQAKENEKYADRNLKHPYLLRGLIECAECGAIMQVQRGEKKGKYNYYRCPTGKVTGNKVVIEKVPRCPARTIRIDIVEKLFWQQMLNLASNPDLLAEAMQSSSEPKEDLTATLLQLEKQEAKLGQAKEKILRLLKKELITEDDAEKELKEIREQLYSLSNKRKNIELQLSAEQNKRAEKENVIELLKKFTKDLTHADFETKRELVLKTVEKVIAKRTDTYWSNEGEPVIELTIKLKI